MSKFPTITSSGGWLWFPNELHAAHIRGVSCPEFGFISLGTVYRNLTLLADIGEIARLRAGDGVDLFDTDTSPHYHFVCIECGAVIDLEMDNFNS